MYGVGIVPDAGTTNPDAKTPLVPEAMSNHPICAISLLLDYIEVETVKLSVGETNVIILVSNRESYLENQQVEIDCLKGSSYVFSEL